ncbi:AAA family ATPase [Microbulbifer sp. TRSA002]|uniref:AAA family ATPase n=1 Tax=Microbulbifer sp. TRSA002 TaxID=3243382 RepID=UPI0040397922
MKIKNVYIQAFKSYLLKSDGTFNFEILTPNGKKDIANLVSIYAPNGFGKTSFYDAIDFTLTNNINRYVQNDNAKINARLSAESGAKYILRNRDADKYEEENKQPLPTELVIETTQGIIKKNVPKPKGKQKSDYLANKSKPKNLSPKSVEHFNRIILSQDAISSFLREVDPKERFEEFSKNSDSKLSGASTKREMIRKLHTHIEKKIKKLEEDKDRKNEKIKLVENKDRPFEQINKIIDTINDTKSWEISKPINPFNSTNQRKFEDEVSVIELQIKNKVEREIQPFINLWESFSGKIESIKLHIENQDKIKNEINNNKRIINNATKLQSLKSKLDHNQKKEYAENLKLNQLKHQKDILPKFIEFNKRKEVLDGKILSTNNEILKNSTTKEILSKSLTEKEEKTSELQRKIVETQIALIELPEKHKQIHQLTQTKAELKNAISNLSSSIDANKDILLQKTKNKSYFSSLEISHPIEAKGVYNEYEGNILQELQSLHGSYVEQSKSLTETNKKIKKHLKLIEEVKDKSDETLKLLHSARKIITESELSQCPVCQHNHKDFAQLQKKVADNDLFDSYQKSLELNFSDIENKKSSIAMELAQIKERYELLLEKLTKNTDNEENQQKLKIENLKLELEANKHEQEKVRDSLATLLEEVQNRTENELSEKYKSKIEINNIEVKEAEKLKHEIQRKISRIDNEEDKLKVKLQSLLEEAIENKIEEDEYIPLAKVLENSKEVGTDLKKKAENFLRKEIHEIEQNIKAISQKNRHIKIEIENLELDLISYDTSSISNYIERLQVLNTNLAENKDYVNEHSKLYTHLHTSAPKDIEQFDEIKHDGEVEFTKLADLKLSHQSYLKYCELLKDLSQKASVSFECQNIKKDVQKITDEIKILEDLLRKISDDLGRINQYIQKEADNFFETELINKIYSAIDPHPDFREVRFECKLIGTDKGELNIFAYDPDKNEKVSPKINFSAAQINVLSLSIFLARALTTLDDQEHPVDCIFIDDPIQSMDSINTLSLIDLLRNLTVRFEKQIIISTHDENFHELLKKKIPPRLFKSKFLRLESFGKVSEDNL